MRDLPGLEHRCNLSQKLLRALVAGTTDLHPPSIDTAVRAWWEKFVQPWWEKFVQPVAASSSSVVRFGERTSWAGSRCGRRSWSMTMWPAGMLASAA
jgi:hypothetical protein